MPNASRTRSSSALSPCWPRSTLPAVVVSSSDSAFARAENATQLVLGASRRSWLAVMLTGPGIGSRTIRGSGDIDVHIVTHGQMGRGRGLPRPRGALTLRRKIAGYVLAAILSLVLTVVLAALRSSK